MPTPLSRGHQRHQVGALEIDPLRNFALLLAPCQRKFVAPRCAAHQRRPSPPFLTSLDLLQPPERTRRCAFSIPTW